MSLLLTIVSLGSLLRTDTSTIAMPKGAPYVYGKRIYERILIRRRQPALQFTQQEAMLPLAAEEELNYKDKQKPQ